MLQAESFAAQHQRDEAAKQFNEMTGQNASVKSQVSMVAHRLRQGPHLEG
jgi:hypothetical protein